ncbi:MAG: glycerophosphodiester phosphodiesterase family protein, partial [Bacillota bacterium]|nr:glycerophosphodiester phosphodiesterase family protein [Bacillota bacterium]
ISIHFSETFDTPKKTYGKGKRRLAASIALTVFVLLVTVFNALASLLIGLFFDEMFMQHADKDIIAHRGGGDLGAENTIAGLDAAIAAGAHGSEIDVQRSKDGIYIIHHDTTFSRLSGVSKKASEMNLDEIRALEVKDLFDTGRPSQKVATLEECLDHAKGRIKLYIELKGETADTAMVDDVVKMIKEKDMVAETAILSLDYALIVYTENRYPEITTGYLYFFSIGNLKTLVADILIMEEREATDKNLDIIHDAGKKAVVWTVNKRDSISRFLRSDVDGIITDYVLKVKDGLTERDNRTDIEVLMDAIFD